MLTVAVPKRNKLQNIIVLTPKDGYVTVYSCRVIFTVVFGEKNIDNQGQKEYNTCLSELS